MYALIIPIKTMAIYSVANLHTNPKQLPRIPDLMILSLSLGSGSAP